ncbi:MAG: ankyrin repeat domain-containing protein [Rhodothermales bacterium]|nr:ankyrin repeat domain-containing protein [Rhodothermales bacterium]
MRRFIYIPFLLILLFLSNPFSRVTTTHSVVSDSLAFTVIVDSSALYAALTDSLHEALWAGDSSAVAQLLASGARPDSIGALDNFTPLHRAVEANRPDLVRLLLEASANPNVMSRNADGNDLTPLHMAAEQGSAAMVSDLLAAGARPDTSTVFRETPLHGVRWMMDEPAIAALLLRQGADPNAQTVFGATPLHHAALLGTSRLTRVLLVNGADPDLVNRKGQSPLHIAAKAGYTGVVALLLDAGGDPDQRDFSGQTPLALATAGDYPDIVRLLLVHGASPAPEELAASAAAH